MVEVNRAVAVGFAAGPGRGAGRADPAGRGPGARRVPPLHAAHADLLRRAGDAAGAADAYRRAIDATANAVERAELERRLAGLTRPGGS